MRIRCQKPKNLDIVQIPKNLILYLKEVYQEIIQGEETATLESGDLLQYENLSFAYGGLINSKTEEFGFTYFTNDENDSKWELVLSKNEIEKIINGSTDKLSLWGCKHILCGCKFSNEEDSCFNCDWVEESKR